MEKAIARVRAFNVCLRKAGAANDNMLARAPIARACAPVRGPIVLALVAGAVFSVMLGIRQSQTLFIGPLNSHTGIGYAQISLAFGVAQLVYGLAQPVAGALADRWGPRWVMISGALLLAAATALTPFAGSAVTLTLLIGIAAAIGTGTMGAPVLIAAANRWIPEAKRSMTTGIINAGGSFGQFTLIPLAQLMIGIAGWQPAMIILGLAALTAVPLVIVLTPSAAVPSASAAPSLGTFRTALSDAVRDRGFVLLCAGFFVCGFHVAFIATHLPGVVALCGLPASVGAWTLAMIGLFNMMGSLWIGKVIQTRRMTHTLAVIYFARALLILAFVFMPKTPMSLFLFGAGIGFTYLSTVPPTAGLVAKLRGTRYFATLFGVVMLSHQIGGFMGAWLGGKVFDLTRSYDSMWVADIALCLLASILHLGISEADERRKTVPA